MSDFKGYTCAAKIVKASIRFWVDQRHALGPFAGDLVMIKDNHISATLANDSNFARRVGPAVYSNDKVGRVLLEAALNSRGAQPIAVLGTKGQKAAYPSAQRGKDALQEGKRSHPVHVIITVEDNSFLSIDGAADASDRFLHFGNEEGILQIAKPRFEEARRGAEIAKPIADQDSRQENWNTQLPAQPVNGRIPICAWENPLPLHLQDSRTSQQCINHTVWVSAKIFPSDIRQVIRSRAGGCFLAVPYLLNSLPSTSLIFRSLGNSLLFLRKAFSPLASLRCLELPVI